MHSCCAPCSVYCVETLRNKGLLNELDDKVIMNYIYNDYEIEFKKIIIEQEAIENFKLLKELKKLKLKLALVTTCRRYYLDILLDKVFPEEGNEQVAFRILNGDQFHLHALIVFAMLYGILADNINVTANQRLQKCRSL